MSKELEALKRVKYNSSKEVVEAFDVIENALIRLESIDNANPSEALECLNILQNVLDKYLKTPLIEYINLFDCINTIKQELIKAQEKEKVLDALKSHLHILPMSDGNDVIGIGCPSNEDVIEPNDFGYDIIKEWLLNG